MIEVAIHIFNFLLKWESWVEIAKIAFVFFAVGMAFPRPTIQIFPHLVAFFSILLVGDILSDVIQLAWSN
jgi:hypothetical protein